MQMHEGKEAAQTQARQDQPTVPLAFPGQPPSQIIVDDQASGGDGSAEGEASAVALTYDSPALGAINFRLGMDGARVVCEVRVAAGVPLELASAAASVLQERLASATDRAASVTVAPRPGSFDVSA
jgi:hypothetical protein